ncbi:MAG: hypothetical protein IKH15_12055 [Bacteroidales bacterium]|nr:hypothetical protein [Bacteroidales bacterium]
MKKIYTFNQFVMNGTVTLKTVTAAFPNKDLAMQTKQILEHANYDNTKLSIMPLKIGFSEVEETILFESADEINAFIKK